jgi:hypothetical protein
MSAAWSRDSKSIAFVRPPAAVRSGPGRPQPGFALMVRSFDTDEERSYPHEGVGAESPRWFNDGSGLLARVSEGGPGGSFCAVDVKTGEFTHCFPRDANGHVRSAVGDVSPDGRTLYLAVKANDTLQARWTGIVGVDLSTGAETPLATFPGAGLMGQGIRTGAQSGRWHARYRGLGRWRGGQPGAPLHDSRRWHRLSRPLRSVFISSTTGPDAMDSRWSVHPVRDDGSHRRMASPADLRGWRRSRARRSGLNETDRSSLAAIAGTRGAS